MKRANLKWTMAGMAGMVCLVFFTSWQVKTGPGTASRYDTTGKDFDRELRDIAKARVDLARAGEQDFVNVEKQLKASLEQLDVQKIQLATQKAMQEVDMKKMEADIERSLKELDFDKLAKEIEADEELSDKQREKIRLHMQKAKEELKAELQNKDWRKDLREIDMKKIEKDLEAAREEILKAREEIGREGINIKEELKKASRELDAAEKEIRGYQKMVYAMEADGLLDTKKDYTIEWKGQSLLINGQQQPETVKNKYASYFNEKDVRINKKDGRINVGHERPAEQ